jgi:dTMP kinase
LKSNPIPLDFLTGVYYIALMFIVFEGVDASGKSTLIQALIKKLQEKNISHIVTREPGGTPVAEEIRNLLLKKGDNTPTPRCELLLYEASRAQHVEKVIEPALKEKKWVLCDRFIASSLAFQCGGRGVNEGEVDMLNAYAINGMEPELTVLLDISIEESELRKNSRSLETGIEKDRFEIEKIDFHERVRNHYLKQAQAQKENWLVLDGKQNTDAILTQLLERLSL